MVCQACGRSVLTGWFSVQHRKARGVGGSDSPENLVTMCGSATSRGCHRLAEDRDPGMRERGFWVPGWLDPGEVPVRLWDGRCVLLMADGGTVAALAWSADARLFRASAAVCAVSAVLAAIAVLHAARPRRPGG